MTELYELEDEVKNAQTLEEVKAVLIKVLIKIGDDYATYKDLYAREMD